MVSVSQETKHEKSWKNSEQNSEQNSGSQRLTIPTPSPWTSDLYMNLANEPVPILKRGGRDHKTDFSNWIYTWGYKDPQPGPKDHRDPDKYDEDSKNSGTFRSAHFLT